MITWWTFYILLVSIWQAKKIRLKFTSYTMLYVYYITKPEKEMCVKQVLQ